ncbi:MAG TPA: ATP-binding protein [Rhizomicrobium sp.]|nr:ATP-binding protein [Rhizomicrobium sp.]
MSELSSVVIASGAGSSGVRFLRNARSVVQPYLLSAGFVVAASALTLALRLVYVGRPSLFPFFAAIAAAAWLGGSGPGFLAAALSAPIGLYFYYSGATHAHGTLAGDIALFVFFAACAFAGGSLNLWRRQADEVLRRAHRQLQTKAVELEAANGALVAEINERRRTEAALEETRNELARVTRLTTMGELTATIAHEINQPLAAVVTNAESCVRWLEPGAPDLAEAREAAKRIVRDANRAGQVIGRVRAMVRRGFSPRAPVAARAVIEDVLALLHAEIAKRKVRLATEFAAGLPQVVADRIQLQQVFVNLITNALESLCDVTDGPRVLTVAAKMEGARTVAITVRDNGRGFEPDVAGRLFQPFVTTKPHGTGLGLSICRSIVEAHGGTLSAASAAPHGAVFTVSLPAAGSAQ